MERMRDFFLRFVPLIANQKCAPKNFHEKINLKSSLSLSMRIL
jgi:hypothetical protein